jgi:hypothetical protein
MSKRLTKEYLQTAFAKLEQQLRAGKLLRSHDFVAPIADAGYSDKYAKDQIIKHGSPFLVSKYKESFGDCPPAELKRPGN